MAIETDVINNIGSDLSITDVISDVIVDLDTVSVAVTPDPTTVSTGTPTRQLAATATLSNGSTVDVTALAAWESDDTDAATVSAAGLVTKVAAGTAIITATYDGFSDTSTVTVS